MSVTVAPKGTRGVPFPRFVGRLFSRFTPGMFRRRPNKTGGGIQTLLLENVRPVLRLQRREGEPQDA